MMLSGLCFTLNGRHPGAARRLRVLATACLALFAAHPISAGEYPRKYIEIKAAPAMFTFDAGNVIGDGRRLWPKRAPDARADHSVRIVNVGARPIVNPRLRINGSRMPLSLDELVEALAADADSPGDAVLRVFHAMAGHAQHGYPVPLDHGDPLSFFLSDLYGDCYYQTVVQARVWQSMGLQWRNSHAFNHVAAEVEIGDETWHLDANLEAFYLKHDNWSIASAQDLRDDPMLVLRSSSYRHSIPTPIAADAEEPDMWPSSEKVAALYGPREGPPDWSRHVEIDQPYEIVLRPGESYGWRTGALDRTFPAYPTEGSVRVAREVRLETDLNFTKPAFRWALAGESDAPTSDTATLAYNLPWPIVAGDLSVRFERGARPVRLTLEGQGVALAELDLPPGAFTGRNVVRLDEWLRSVEHPVRALRIGLAPLAGEPPLRLRGLKATLYGRGTTWSCPGFLSGRNEIQYSDDSTERNVRVEMRAEGRKDALPKFTMGDFFPPDGARTPEAALRFEWPGCKGGEAVGYQLQISAYEDMRYPLSPTFDRLLRREVLEGERSYRLPWRGLLPVDRTLFWRIRPYGAGPTAGDWSEVRSFVVQGPTSPETAALHEEEGRLAVAWRRGTGGTEPAFYEVHASPLEGFIPFAAPHRILGFERSEGEASLRWNDVTATGWPTAPSTMLAETDELHLTLFDPEGGEEEAPPLPGAHLRVVAVDADGSRSAPSPQLHLPSPLLLAPARVLVAPGEVEWTVPVALTTGRILCKPEYFLGLWNDFTPTFRRWVIEGSPGTWTMEEKEGALRGFLEPGQAAVLDIIIEDASGRSSARRVTFVADAES